MVKIKSKTDVITNSSNEVFVYKKSSQEFKDICEFLGPELSKEFETYNSLEDIWEKINSSDYCGGIMEYPSSTQGEYGDSDWGGLLLDPFSYNKDWELFESMNNLIRNNIKTKREVFDFFAPIYEEALDYAMFSFCNEGGYEPKLVKKIREYYALKRKKIRKEILGKFKPGDIIYSEITDEELKKFYPIGKFITLISEINEDFNIIPGVAYCEDWLNWDKDPKHLERGFSNGISFKKPYIGGHNINTIRLATEEEQEILFNAIKKAGFTINKETFKVE